MVSLREDPPPQSPKGHKEWSYLFSRPSLNFWDHLSRIWLTHSAIQEFDRRTVQLVIPKPKHPSDFKGHPTKELKRFARRGGPSLCNFRGYAGAQSTRAMSTRRRPRRTQKIMPDDPNYEQHLKDFGVSFRRGPDPKNLQELKTRLGTRRPSLSDSRFSQQDFENFEDHNVLAQTEAEAVLNVFPIIRGNSTLFSCQKRIFSNLSPLDPKLATATPDFYDGSRSENLDPHVRSELEDLIMPSKDSSSTLLPNFFLEINGFKGNLDILRLQLARDLVCGARGMLAIQTYSNRDSIYDAIAYTIGAIYNANSGILKFYTMILTQPANLTGRPIYHMIKLESFDLSHSAETCRNGINWFRNARDFAKDIRDEAIASANRVAHDRNDGASAATSTNYPLVSSFPNGMSGLVPGSWLGGPSTSQAQAPPTTGGTASDTSGTGHEEPAGAVDEPSEDAGPW